jgi:cell division protease FtsH
MLMGGRTAEELACEDISTGSEDDLERATEMARQMVCRFGMSEALGPVTLGRSGRTRFFPMMDAAERNFSEETARRIDAEIRTLLDSEHERARRALVENRVALDAIASELLQHETLQRSELEAILQSKSSNGRSTASATSATRPKDLLHGDPSHDRR